jgi:Fic family protein
LSAINQALGRLDRVSTIQPDPDLFVAMYVRRAAVLSFQLEGTQSTLWKTSSSSGSTRAGGVCPGGIREVVDDRA